MSRLAPPNCADWKHTTRLYYCSVPKYTAFRALTEKMVPGSGDYLLLMTDKQMAKTLVLKVPISEASPTIRQGPLSGETSERPIWTGLIPIKLLRALPEAGLAVTGIELAEYLW